MFEEQFHISKLLAGHFRNALSPDQEQELEAWKNSSAENKQYFEELADENILPARLYAYQSVSKDAEDVIWNKTLGILGKSFEEKDVPVMSGTVRTLWFRIAAVAAVVTLIFGASLFYYAHDSAAPAAYANDIPAGRSSATLTLADGRKIILSDAENGQLAKEAGIRISKTADGKLVYTVLPVDGGQQASGGESQFNTLSTANGEQYQVLLPDGSSAFLNAASSLTFPTNLDRSKLREVKATGEVYFEIAKDQAHPFLVKTGTQTIQVLGTHFNVNAYGDEPGIKTTLVEGSVKLSTNGSADHEEFLKPGQQSVLVNDDFKISTANTDVNLAWINGKFIFDGERLEVTMRQVARWYNVEIVYAPGVPKDFTLLGNVSRSRSISSILSRIELIGKVKFKIEGRKVTVLPIA